MTFIGHVQFHKLHSSTCSTAEVAFLFYMEAQTCCTRVRQVVYHLMSSVTGKRLGY